MRPSVILSEADHVYENPQLREIMTLGKKFGSPELNVVDGAAVPGSARQLQI